MYSKKAELNKRITLPFFNEIHFQSEKYVSNPKKSSSLQTESETVKLNHILPGRLFSVSTPNVFTLLLLMYRVPCLDRWLHLLLKS